MAIAMAGGATRAGAGSLLLLLLVALAGGVSATVATFSGVDNTIDSGDAAALLMTPKPPPPSPEELTGFMECLLGCFTQVFGCSFGCMAKGPDLPLCVISCDQKSVVCMIRCGLSPSPPGPKPPGPKPPGPKPPSPKPPAPKPPPPTPAPPTPGPPYTPPYAATGRKIATYA